MRIASFGLAVLPLVLMAATASAQDATDVSSAAIADGSYATAEKTLVQELRIHPGRPELLINLAAVYAGTGRPGDARALYQQVLAQDDVLMDLSAERTAGSHAIARTGLRRLAGAQMTLR